jgi:uncharacterized sulfatase
MLTGTYPSKHGAWSIGVSADPFPTPSMPLAMNDAGYHTALIGKHHFVRRREEDEHIRQGDDSPDFYEKGACSYAGFTEAWLSSGHTISGSPAMHCKVWMENQNVPMENYYPNQGAKVEEYGPWALPAHLTDSQWVSDRSIDIIARDHDKPWFIWANFQDPHGPHVCSEPWYSAVPEEAINCYQDAIEGEFDQKPDFYRQLHESDQDWGKKTFRIDGFEVGGVYAIAKSRGKEREALRATLGMMMQLDHHIGRILEEIETSGQMENTLIVFSSDHGTMHGHHGFWGKGLTTFEDCQRVPFIASGKGVKETGTCDALINTIDLPRTFMELAGVKIPQGIQGQSLIPLFEGVAKQVQESTVVECRGGMHDLIQRTMITADNWKLVLYGDIAEGEMYHLNEDPNQYQNLWNVPEYLTQKNELILKFARREISRDGEVKPRLHFA